MSVVKRNLIFTGALVALGVLALILIPLFVQNSAQPIYNPAAAEKKMVDLQGTWVGQDDRYVMTASIANERVVVTIDMKYQGKAIGAPIVYWSGSFKASDLTESVVVSHRDETNMKSDSETKQFIYNNKSISLSYMVRDSTFNVEMHRA